MHVKQTSHSFITNSFYNIAGHILPLTIGILCIPYLIKSIGMERFGILSIVWTIIGYFSLFDFGLSRTLTVKVAELSSLGKYDEVNTVFWTSLKWISIATAIGSLCITTVLFFKNHFITLASREIYDEAFSSIFIIALTLPAVTITSGVKGALEAESKFYGINLIQTISGSLNFLTPLIVSQYSQNLFYIILSLSLLRFIFLIIHFMYLKQTCVWISKVKFLSLTESLPILTSGGWFAVTNIIGPVMTYFDRFLIASMIPAATLPYYTTPFEIINKLLIIPSSITRALFPILASNSEKNDNSLIYRLSLKIIAISCGLILALGVGFGFQGIQFWLGSDFAKSSFTIFLILLFGFFGNSLAWPPFNLIQAFQKPKITAIIHLIELPFYIALLIILTKKYGLIGTAISWSVRNIIDYFAMSYISQKIRYSKWIKKQ